MAEPRTEHREEPKGKEEHKEKLAKDASAAKEAGRDVAEAAVHDGKGAAAERAADRAGSLQDVAQDAARQVQALSPDNTQQLVRSVLKWTREEPAYSLGGALAVGFFVGKVWGRMKSRH